MDSLTLGKNRSLVLETDDMITGVIIYNLQTSQMFFFYDTKMVEQIHCLVWWTWWLFCGESLMLVINNEKVLFQIRLSRCWWQGVPWTLLTFMLMFACRSVREHLDHRLKCVRAYTCTTSFSWIKLQSLIFPISSKD